MALFNRHRLARPRAVGAIAIVLMMTAVLASASACGRHHKKAKADPIAAVLSRMTVEQKVGQLFVVKLYGGTADTSSPSNATNFGAGLDTPAKVISRYNPGGVIYFRAPGNLGAPRQIAELSNGLQQAAVNSGARVPLLISTDEENGTIDRVRSPATVLPAGMALGSAYLGARSAGKSPQDAAADARQAAEITGTELRAMGINLDFAPDADVNANPANPIIGVRSFSSDPAIVSTLVTAQVQGLQGSKPSQGVSATAKHFPGHGDTSVDSHTGIPVVNTDHDEWSRVAAPPFRAAVKAGIDSIMTAHIVMPKLDPSGDPTTLSQPILTGLLRKELGYNGVVFTDSLEMQGVRAKYGDDRVPVLALKAGADMLLTPPDFQKAYNGVLAAVRSGEITEERLDQSVTRILRMKSRRGILSSPMVDTAKVESTVGAQANLQAAQRIADDSITKLRDDQKLVPAKMSGGRILVTGWGSTNYPDGRNTAQLLADRLRARGATATALATGAEPSTARISAAVAAAKNADTVVVLTNRTAATDSGRAQETLISQLVASGVHLIAVAVREPYDAGQFTAATTWLASYGYGEPTLESIAKTIAGELTPTGRLPVAVPAAQGGEAYRLGGG